ncbi:MAG: SDR family oxidoreductase [Chloroflexi bacterium]|nr:SDR family oxidoreductase [Chloroflexota bacterium]
MDLRIKGRVAMVSGGSRGLGRQVALTLGREGCKVVICARNAEGLDRAVAEMTGLGYQALGLQADVMTGDGCQRFYDEALRAFGQVDILVNNVGGTRGGRDFDSTTDEHWVDTLNLNLLSAVRLTRLVLPGMKARCWGRIVSIASIWGREYGGGLSYMVGKAALIAFSKHMAQGLAPYNVLVNSVAPGSIRFPGGSWERFVQNNPPETVQGFIRQQLPMGRFGWPEPVGELVAFLCSERADLVTGACYTVDGGQSRSLT